MRAHLPDFRAFWTGLIVLFVTSGAREVADVTGGVAIQCVHFANAGLFHFINPNHGMNRDKAAFHCLELGFEAFFTGVDDQAALCAKHNFFDHHKTVQVRFVNLLGEDFVNPVLIDEGYAVDAVTAFAQGTLASKKNGAVVAESTA